MTFPQSVMKPSEKAPLIAEMYRQGKTLQEIGDQFLVTRERIRQILKKNGVTWEDGGQHRKAVDRKLRVAALREARYQAKHGCSFAQYREMVDTCFKLMEGGTSQHTTPLGAFTSQKNNSSLRGIEFKLKFWDWWRVWQESGKWEQRGRGQGYVMARIGDKGPYELGNIYITTASKNIKHSQELRQKKSFDDWTDVYFPTMEAAA